MRMPGAAKLPRVAAHVCMPLVAAVVVRTIAQVRSLSLSRFFSVARSMPTVRATFKLFCTFRSVLVYAYFNTINDIPFWHLT